MKVEELTYGHLEQLEKLLTQKAKLQAELAELSDKLANLGNGASISSGQNDEDKRPATTPRVSVKRRRTYDPTMLKARLLGALESAGPKGIALKRLAHRVGRSGREIWPFLNRELAGECKKLGRGRYVLASQMTTQSNADHFNPVIGTTFASSSPNHA